MKVIHTNYWVKETHTKCWITAIHTRLIPNISWKKLLEGKWIKSDSTQMLQRSITNYNKSPEWLLTFRQQKTIQISNKTRYGRVSAYKDDFFLDGGGRGASHPLPPPLPPPPPYKHPLAHCGTIVAKIRWAQVVWWFFLTSSEGEKVAYLQYSHIQYCANIDLTILRAKTFFSLMCKIRYFLFIYHMDSQKDPMTYE